MIQDTSLYQNDPGLIDEIVKLKAQVVQLQLERDVAQKEQLTAIEDRDSAEQLKRLAEARVDELVSSHQICVGAAGIGDFSELCGWIDSIKARVAELENKVIYYKSICDSGQEEFKSYQSALKEANVALEFYSSEKSWLDQNFPHGDYLSEALVDKGEEARKALATINKALEDNK